LTANCCVGALVIGCGWCCSSRCTPCHARAGALLIGCGLCCCSRCTPWHASACHLSSEGLTLNLRSPKLAQAELTMEEFIDLSILLGCDYVDKIRRCHLSPRACTHTCVHLYHRTAPPHPNP
jgi:hypothetical protein